MGSGLDGHHGNRHCGFWLGRAEHDGGYCWTRGSGSWGERSRGPVQDALIGTEVSSHVIRVRGCGETEVPAGIGAPAVPILT